MTKVTIEGEALSHYVKIDPKLKKEFGRVIIYSPEKLEENSVGSIIRLAYDHMKKEHFGGIGNYNFPARDNELRKKNISCDVIATFKGKFNIRFPYIQPTCGGYPI